MTYKISRSVPLTSRRVGRRPEELQYPLQQLEIGDSYFVPVAKKDTAERKRVGSYPASKEKRLGRKFAVRWRRPEDEIADGFPDHGYGVRVWRIA